jgi:bla regulator protein blaR1
MRRFASLASECATDMPQNNLDNCRMKNTVAGIPRINDVGVGKRLLLAALAMGAVAGPLAFGLMQEVSHSDQVLHAKGPLPSFEVASIKPDHSGSGIANLGFPGHSVPKDRFIATNFAIKDLICWAFAGNSFPLPGDEVSGGPSWINSEHYDIDAKLDDSEVAALAKLSAPDGLVQVRLMVQSLLADRFDLVVKNETVMRPVYALVIAKGGPKLQETAPWSTGSKSQAFSAVHGEITTHGMPISRLVWALSRVGVGRPVLDQTGLKGNYSFDLKWTPDLNLPGMMPGPSPSAESAPPDTSGPSIFTAIREQLGLELKATKGPVEALVIAHIEKPLEN